MNGNYEYNKQLPLVSTCTCLHVRVPICAGHLKLSHALIRQAEQGVSGNADGLRIIDSDIMSCRQGVALSSGSSRYVNVTSLQPDKFLMRGSRVMYGDEGLLLSAVTGNESIYVTSSVEHGCNIISDHDVFPYIMAHKPTWYVIGSPLW